MTLRLVRDRAAQAMAQMDRLTRRHVLVGVPAENAPRDAEAAAQSEGPLSNAALAYIHDNGAPEANIPARPFLRRGVSSAMPKVADTLAKGARLALAGDAGAADKALTSAGLRAQREVQKEITDGEFAPLAEATLRARRARGRTGEKPLLDTGQLRRSITYVVRDKGKGS